MTDEELVSGFLNDGDTKLFEILYKRYSIKIYNKCYSFVNNEEEAKDLAHDIFLKLFTKITSFKNQSKFSTWLYAFTFNHCVNHLKRNKSKKLENRISDVFDINNYPEEIITSNSLITNLDEKLNSALDKIPPKDKQIIQLKYLDNLSIKNIESVLGIGPSAIKMRIKRAKEKLLICYA